MADRITADNDQTAPFGDALHEMDTEAFFNMRNWFKMACEAAGGRFVGGGVGMGQADLDIKIDGNTYNISIRPYPKGK